MEAQNVCLKVLSRVPSPDFSVLFRMISRRETGLGEIANYLSYQTWRLTERHLIHLALKGWQQHARDMASIDESGLLFDVKLMDDV